MHCTSVVHAQLILRLYKRIVPKSSSLKMAAKHLLVVALVALVVAQTLAAPQPQPWSLKKAVSNAANKVKAAVAPAVKKVAAKWGPTFTCLKNAGASDAALGWLKDCGQTKFYGKFAMASCVGTEYAPSDVKAMLKSSKKCFA